MIPLSTSIYTPNGWKHIADCNIGDEIYTPDGDVQTITQITDPVEQSLFSVNFKDQRYIKVAGNQSFTHIYVNPNLPSSIPIQQRFKFMKFTTREVLHRMMTMGVRGQSQIRGCFLRNTPEKELPIHPYLLGVLLGDGCFVNKSVSVSTDKEIIESLRPLLPKDMEIYYWPKEPQGTCHWATLRGTTYVGQHKYNPLMKQLEKLGLRGCRTKFKFVPEMYLHGSYQQRRDLIAGLMDTDGSAPLKGGTIIFSTISPLLAEGFTYLVRSIGGMAKMNIVAAGKNGNRANSQQIYVFSLRFPYPREFFKLTRKYERVKDRTFNSPGFKFHITSVVPLPEKAVCVGISTDSIKNEFVGENFIALTGI